MKKSTAFFLFICSLLFSSPVCSQYRLNLERALAPETYDNIHIQHLFHDSLASGYLIWVKREVKKHKHAEHSENLYVLAGEGQMVLGDTTLELASGDFIFIPKGTVHGVSVSSKTPLKVLSIQTPKFLGEDRIFVD